MPRVKGERVQWARRLGLEGLLAKHLPLGSFSDQLSGIKKVTKEELKAAIERFIADVPSVIEHGVEVLKAAGKAGSASSSAVQEHINTKFALEGAFVGKFATLDDFHKGPEGLIGTPNPKIMVGMEIEHCRRGNCSTEFTSGNYNLTTTPITEWEFVVMPRDGVPYPHTPSDKALWRGGNEWKGTEGRDVILLAVFMEKKEVKRAALKEEEVIGLRLYTGPMFVLYNAVLRGFPEWDVKCLLDQAGKENRYETTIFAIASGITKLSKVTKVPVDRRLYRGLGGMVLPKQFWKDYLECHVSFTLTIGQGEEAGGVMTKLKDSIYRSAGSGTDAYEKNIDYLRLGLPVEKADVQEETAQAAGLIEIATKGVRVVREARQDGDVMRMSVALPVSKDAFEKWFKGPFEEAVRALCGGRGEVRIEEVADKPEDFRGGGEWPLPCCVGRS